jgi:uncharacterized membrane protein
MEFLRGGSLLLAVLTTGLVTGVMLLYAHTIMPGLAKTDDKTFVGAFQAMDRAIINPLFLFTFLGSFVLILLAALVSLRTPLLWWLVVAAALYLAVLVITFSVNVPLNDALKAAGDPAHIADLKAARENFNEALWVRWNIVRSIASMGAFACLTWALVLFGRISA